MNISIEPIKSLLVLYVALNYNGYDNENNSKGMYSLRIWVREYLENKQIERYDFKWHPYQYTKVVLSINNLNPDFLPAINYLKKFVEQSEFESIWPKIEKETEMALVPYRKLVEKAIRRVDEVFEMSRASGDILFTVNLLESYWRGFSIQDKGRTILITGPSDEPNISNVVHEYMHSYFNDVDFGEVDDNLYSKISEELQKNYPKNMIVEESLIRAMEVYLSRHHGIPGGTEFGNQARDLGFPKIYLERLEKLKPDNISMAVLEKII
jgi:hypothetical protein